MRTHGWAALLGACAVISGAGGLAGCSDGSAEKEKLELAGKLEDCKRARRSMEDELAVAKQKLAKAIESPEAIRLDEEALRLVADLRPGGKPTEPDAGQGKSLDKRAVLDVVRLNRGALQACWERALKRNNDLQYVSPKLTLAFDVRSVGAVGEVRIHPVHDGQLDACLKQAIGRWRFPAFEGDPVRIEAPVSLETKR